MKDKHIYNIFVNRISRDFVAVVLIFISLFYFYFEILGFDFQTLDDSRYIINNSNVKEGMSIESTTWAFSSFFASMWQPLTWLSFMLDVHIYGLNPFGFHLTNILLHIANACLLFFLLKKTTGRFSSSLIIALLFALHPLRVESVAWIAERKDVLSGFFGILTLLFYTEYCRSGSVIRYIAALLLYSLGLMSKAILVTLPFVMLLLDYWPLERFKYRFIDEKAESNIVFFKDKVKLFSSLIIEKIPFLLFSLASVIVTFIATMEDIASLEVYSFKIRILNALVSYIRYISKILWPENLTVFYPHPGNDLTLLAGGGALLILSGISLAAILGIKKYPYLFVGWFWFLGMLFPMSGVTQVSNQAMADRFTYFPSIGFFIAATWVFADIGKQKRLPMSVMAIVPVVIISFLAIRTGQQIKYWRNTETLALHSLEVTENNYIAHLDLFTYYTDKGKIEEAKRHYLKAIDMNPDHVIAWHQIMGGHNLEKGQYMHAMNHFKEAFIISGKTDADSLNRWGVTLALMYQDVEAKKIFLQVLELDPNHKKAKKNLEMILRVLSPDYKKGENIKFVT